MRKLKTAIAIIILSLMLGTTITLAASGAVSINGDSTVNVGESKSLKLKISSDKPVGAISATLQTNLNVTEVKAMNGWNLTHNKATGKIILYKAEGSTSEEFIEIKYSATNEGSVNVKLENIELSAIETNGDSVEYITIKPSDVTKTVTIQKKQNNSNTNIPEINIIDNEPEEVDNTVSKGDIPQTGEENFILIPITVITVLSVIFYIKYMQYRKNV